MQVGGRCADGDGFPVVLRSLQPGVQDPVVEELATGEQEQDDPLHSQPRPDLHAR